MNNNTKNLAKFSLIFIVGAIAIIFFLKGGNKPQLPTGHPSPDEAIAAMDREIEAIEKQIESNPDNAELYTRLGNHYFDTNKYHLAIDAYNKALKTTPRNAMVLTDCAVMYYRTDQIEKALAYLDSALAIEPELGQAYFNKGVIYMSAMNDHEKALEYWREFVRISPDSEMAKMIKGQIEAVEQQQQSNQ